MCHRFDFRARIELYEPTLSPSDLLVTKLQIVELNEKDLKDMVTLLREHEVLNELSNQDAIDTRYIAELCSKDWGIYRTFTGNISRLDEFISTLTLENTDKNAARSKLGELSKSIELAPKSVKWKMRAKVGEKRRWYDLPETRI